MLSRWFDSLSSYSRRTTFGWFVALLIVTGLLLICQLQFIAGITCCHALYMLSIGVQT